MTPGFTSILTRGQYARLWCPPPAWAIQHPIRVRGWSVSRGIACRVSRPLPPSPETCRTRFPKTFPFLVEVSTILASSPVIITPPLRNEDRLAVSTRSPRCSVTILLRPTIQHHPPPSPTLCLRGANSSFFFILPQPCIFSWHAPLRTPPRGATRATILGSSG